MNYEIKQQETYSRGELLLRTFFGSLYIGFPHYFVLFFVSLYVAIINILVWFIILFTGKFPRNFFDLNLKYYRWVVRVDSRLNNYLDGYPEFGLDVQDENVTLDAEYTEEYSRVQLLLLTFFGVLYVAIPHGFALLFRFIATAFLSFFAWFAVLFTGKYPKEWFDFNIGTYRWYYRVLFYLSYMSKKYPPFSGKRDLELEM